MIINKSLLFKILSYLHAYINKIFTTQISKTTVNFYNIPRKSFTDPSTFYLLYNNTNSRQHLKNFNLFSSLFKI